MQRIEWGIRLFMNPINFLMMQRLIAAIVLEQQKPLYPFNEIIKGEIKRDKIMDLHIASSQFAIWGLYWTSIIKNIHEIETLRLETEEIFTRYEIPEFVKRDITIFLEATGLIGNAYRLIIREPQININEANCMLDCLACCQDDSCRQLYDKSFDECMKKCLKDCGIGL